MKNFCLILLIFVKLVCISQAQNDNWLNDEASNSDVITLVDDENRKIEDRADADDYEGESTRSDSAALCGKPFKTAPTMRMVSEAARATDDDNDDSAHGFLPDQFSELPDGRDFSDAVAAVEASSSDGADSFNGWSDFEAETRIVGGNVTAIEQWPWQVSIRIATSRKHFCGGSIIAPDVILTAAHCFRVLRKPSQILVYAGKSAKEVGESGEVVSTVKKILIHAKFDKPIHDNDIALLKLDKPLVYSHRIAPICLPNVPPGSPPPIGACCYISGYGETKGTGFENNLKVARIDIIPHAQCLGLGQQYKSRLTKNMVCAGELKGGVDSCQGDSGGPLICEDVIEAPGVFFQYGVVSFGWGCAQPDHVGVYAKITNYLSWIESVSKN